MSYSDTATELFNFAKSDTKTWGRVEASYTCLEGHLLRAAQGRGEYNRSKALKLLLNNAKDAAKAYTSEYMPDLAWSVHFPMDVRLEVAAMLLEYMEREHKATNWWSDAGRELVDGRLGA